LSARGIKKVRDVFWFDELGMPECLWVYDVEDFGPMIITIDTHGGNVTQAIKAQVTERMEKIMAEMEG
jgi:tartrate dehydratase beta subunit/fumarate hydratase class I family protein